ncbi:SDR family NAD(P)-dependent oxidoreductase [Paenibacillus sp. N3.4]|uniref:SDR family NAD(P)-dependent oxidoreductase n=1 Tax=Paenibacillus sp. N3.4 TaxID=2603222 RepID=UPI0011C7B4B7|nr:SDR family NAD(P)-dependent oxidoreductase [Paenibacillus sp. N3.4]TXK84147.1 SDR family NAD(P)-dependent oxidoreductase [Paenibacillus sp. N3.4]
MSKPLLVLVGAGPGVSAGVARKFGAKGYRIVLVARSEPSLSLYTKELHENEIEAYSVQADASDTDSLIAAFAHIQAEYGATDVLVYNAAALVQGNPSSLTEEQLIHDFKVNVVGALTSAKQVIPSFVERKQGTILFTGGGLALYPAAALTSLSIGKAGIRSLAFTLAEELQPHGIHVGTVTIAGGVKPGTFFDPDAIAESYWDLHANRDKNEIVFKQP